MAQPRKMSGPRASTAAGLSKATGKLFPTRSVNLKSPLPPGTGPFWDDVDPEDSERLRRLRNIIDEEIGWSSKADEEGGDYESRLREVGLLLTKLGVKRFSLIARGKSSNLWAKR